MRCAAACDGLQSSAPRFQGGWMQARRPRKLRAAVAVAGHTAGSTSDTAAAAIRCSQQAQGHSLGLPRLQQLVRRSQRGSVRAAAQLSERELTIKLAIAQSTDKLDLSGCELTEIPAAAFELTGLVELSLSGNQLCELPAEIGRLSCLQRLVLAGNWLQQLPAELLQLTRLEGLWVHGNLLQDVPEQLGSLSQLKQLSLAGNCLQAVPDSLSQLVFLQDLNLSGNAISQLPEGIGALTALKKLALHGNRLRSLPQHGWQHLEQLDEITAAGNLLTEVPDSLAQLRGLTELSLADNQLRRLPDDLSGLTKLAKLHLYGNQLTSLPLGPRGLPSLQPAPADGNGNGSSSRRGRSSGSISVSSTMDSSIDEGGSSSGGSGRLASLWLEGTPLSDSCVAELLAAMGPPGTTRIGVDQQQLAGSTAAAEFQALRAAGNTSVRAGVVLGEGPGYFKLQLGPQHSGGSNNGGSSNRVLVVAFGSAPGLPNWGGVMRRVAAAAEEPEHSCFDVLYVVDPCRSWYCGGDAALMEQQYTSRLRHYTQQYDNVVMIGDSMGASAALLFSPLATAVLSFCPQVDLRTSSIRPGQPPAWQDALQATLQAAVAGSTARTRVFTGTWQHDVDQANLLAQHQHVQIKVYSVDSHRLALALAARGSLAPLIREAVLGELGLSSGNVRLVNLL